MRGKKDTPSIKKDIKGQGTEQAADPKDVGGRPERYSVNIKNLSGIAAKELGLTQNELADVFGVHRTTFARWCREHPELREAIRNGRYEFDTVHVENALLKRARGFEYDEMTTTVDSDGHEELKVVHKIVPPDAACLRLWLRNRGADRWQDADKVEVSGTLTLAEELAAARARAKKAKEKESL